MTTTITLTLPSGHVEHLTQEQWTSLRGNANRQLPGSGRARQADRCPCGDYTKHSARMRKHVCKTGATV